MISSIYVSKAEHAWNASASSGENKQKLSKAGEHLLQHKLKKPRGFPRGLRKTGEPDYQHGPVKVIYSRGRESAALPQKDTV